MSVVWTKSEARKAYREAVKKGWWDGAPGLGADEWTSKVAGYAVAAGVDRERAFAAIAGELPRRFHAVARAVVAEVYAEGGEA